MFTLLRNRFFGGKKIVRKPIRRPSVRPCLERLEERLCPANATWTDNDHATPTNPNGNDYWA